MYSLIERINILTFLVTLVAAIAIIIFLGAMCRDALPKEGIICGICGTKSPIEYHYTNTVKATCKGCGRVVRAHVY